MAKLSTGDMFRSCLTVTDRIRIWTGQEKIPIESLDERKLHGILGFLVNPELRLVADGFKTKYAIAFDKNEYKHPRGIEKLFTLNQRRSINKLLIRFFPEHKREFITKVLFSQAIMLIIMITQNIHSTYAARKYLKKIAGPKTQEPNEGNQQVVA